MNADACALCASGIEFKGKVKVGVTAHLRR